MKDLTAKIQEIREENECNCDNEIDDEGNQVQICNNNPTVLALCDALEEARKQRDAYIDPFCLRLESFTQCQGYCDSRLLAILEGK